MKKKTIIFTGKNSSVVKYFLKYEDCSKYKVYIFSTSKKETKDELKI